MGSTIWVLARSRREHGDDYDHSLFYAHADELDALAEEIGARKLSEFFDWSDLEFNSSDQPLQESWIEEHETWHSPRDALPSLKAVIQHLRRGDTSIDALNRDELLQELEDCLSKLEDAQARNDAFQFCVVM
jgi:hypothetical protein